MKIYFNLRSWLLLTSMIFCNVMLFAQEEKKEEKKELVAPLKIKFSESGNQYLQFGVLGQFWVRYTENNPGTYVNGLPSKGEYDAGIRRMQVFSIVQVSKRFKMFYMLGMGPQSFIAGSVTKGVGPEGYGKKPRLFFYDAYGDFVVVPKTKNFSLSIGVGLHSWDGISRLSNASSNSLLSADSPNYNNPTGEMSDQLSRQFGIFAHGDIGRLAYRFNVNKPFATDSQPKSTNTAVDNNLKGNLSTAGYLFYQFKDIESVVIPFLAGTYLGQKKIFNIGAGFYENPDGTATLKSDGKSLSYHDITAFGVDLFTEFPVGDSSKNMSVSIYSVFYDYNLGPNYLGATVGIMNPVGIQTDQDLNKNAVNRVFEGPGNARISFGTGTVWHTQAGFLLPKFSDKIRIQPYAVYVLKNLDALKGSGHYYDVGANLILSGHAAKITVQYSNRPLYNMQTLRTVHRAGELFASVQISL